MIDFPTLIERLKTILGEEFEDEVKCEIEACNFGKTTEGPLEIRFEEWLIHRIWQDKGLAVFESFLVTRQMRTLAEDIGAILPEETIPRQKIRQLLEKQLGIPDLQITGRSSYKKRIEDLLNKDISNAITEARQMAEQLLREILLVLCSTTANEAILQSIAQNKSLRPPPQWGKKEQLTPFQLLQNLKNTTAGDLGLLNLLLECATEKIRNENIKVGYPAFEAAAGYSHNNAFMKLAKAIHPYVHFRPDCKDDREETMKEALNQFADVIGALTEANIIPEAAIFLEKTTGIFGNFFRGIGESGKIEIRSDEDIPLEKRVLFWKIGNPVSRIAAWAEAGW